MPKSKTEILRPENKAKMKGDFGAIEKVESNDELLISILVLLPPKSVFSLMLVSKRWYHIFDQPGHRRAYVKANTKGSQCLLGLIYNGKILPLRQTNNLKINQIPRGCGEYVNSSNGLILCKTNPRYHILNPITDQARISFPGPDFCLVDFGLAYLENSPRLALSFKVVGIVINNGKREDKTTLLIGTYSSETRKWTKSTLTGPEEFKLYAMPPFVVNGIFHWRALYGILAVYDSNGDENYVQLIKEPPSPEPSYSGVTLTRSSQDNVIWVGKYSRSCICLWMLPNDWSRSYRRPKTIQEKEWILVHTINQDYLLLTVMSPSTRYFSLEGLIPGNPVIAILSMNRSIYTYDFERESIQLVFPYEATSLSELSGWHQYSGVSNWRYFYMGPLSLSSCALSSYN